MPSLTDTAFSMKFSSLVTAALFAIPAATAAWLGASYHFGHEVENAMQAMRTAPSSSAALRVMDVYHERGLLQSAGTMNLRLAEACGGSSGADSLSFQLRYHVNHFPAHQGPVRFSWALEPAGDTRSALRRVVHHALALHGTGRGTYGGAINSSLELNEIMVREDGHLLQISATSGQFRLQGKQLAFDLRTPRVVMLGQGEAAELTGATVRGNLQDITRGTGTLTVGFSKFRGSFGSAEGFSLATAATEEGDRLNVSATPRLRRLTAQAMSLEDLTLELGVNGLDTASVLQLLTLAHAGCGLLALTPDEQASARKAAQTLLKRGFSAGVTRIAGKSADGALDGQWMITLAASQDGSLRLQDQLRSSGHLSFTGQALTPKLRTMAVDSGLAVTREGVVRAGYEYGRGTLKINDRPVDGTTIEQALDLLGLALGREGLQ